MVAAASGHDECVHLLLSSGAAVAHADRWGRTALHLAAQSAHSEAVRMLLAAGADPFVEDCKGDCKQPWLSLDAGVSLRTCNCARCMVQSSVRLVWVAAGDAASCSSAGTLLSASLTAGSPCAAGYTTLDFALKLDPTAADSQGIVNTIKDRARFSGPLKMKVGQSEEAVQ